MKFLIKNAETKESNILSELAMESKAYWGYSEKFMQSCRNELSVTPNMISNPKFHYYVAKCKNKILGFYALEILNESTIELEALFVQPQVIGKGIGKVLIMHAKKTAVKLGANKIIIQGEPNAEMFYLSVGAKRVGEKESGSIAGRKLPLFEISL